MLELFNENVYFTTESHLYSVLSKQLIKLSLVKFELLSKMLMDCLTPTTY